MHWGETKFALGNIKGHFRFEVETEELAGVEHRRLHLLTKLVQGMADAADLREWESLMVSAKVLNGPTMDAALDRPALSKRPCGCKGKN